MLLVESSFLSSSFRLLFICLGWRIWEESGTGIPKEYIEVYCGGKVGIVDDFKSADIWSNGKRKKKKLYRQDKGQRCQMEAWVEGLKKGSSPISFHEIINVHKTCLMAIESMKNREALKIE